MNLAPDSPRLRFNLSKILSRLECLRAPRPYGLSPDPDRRGITKSIQKFARVSVRTSLETSFLLSLGRRYVLVNCECRTLIPKIFHHDVVATPSCACAARAGGSRLGLPGQAPCPAHRISLRASYRRLWSAPSQPGSIRDKC